MRHNQGPSTLCSSIGAATYVPSAAGPASRRLVSWMKTLLILKLEKPENNPLQVMQRPHEDQAMKETVAWALQQSRVSLKMT